MGQQNRWCQQSDNLLKYLYEDLQIFNWGLISKHLFDRLGVRTDAAQCRNRYVQKYGPVVRNQWTPEQEKQLYRLHNQNGNKWAIIAQNLLGRNDNCVKNHFYSKLRKSLRTINKIAKLYLKKQTKQVSDVVLYKLTQVTDQSIKHNPDISKEIYAMSHDLKNKLLQYQVDQKDIKSSLDYSYQKQIIQGLFQFNKIYKKKPKKQKITLLGTENLKKRHVDDKKNSRSPRANIRSQKSQQNNKKDQQGQQEQQSNQQFRSISNSFRNYHGRKSHLKFQINDYSNFEHDNPFGKQQVYFPPRSESEYSTHKITVNYLIKAPSLEEKKNHEQMINMSSQKQTKKENIVVPKISSIFQKNQKPQVLDILKAEGILQNEQFGTPFKNKEFFKRSHSVRSFSVCSESSHPDMFEQDPVFPHRMQQFSQLDNQSQISNNHQNI